MTAELVVERRDQLDETPMVDTAAGVLMLTPPIDESYWSYRVRLTERQAVIAFPKFATIGIGFAVEDDWNTNLPYLVDADRILAHIGHNKGDDAIDDADVLRAIVLIQEAITADGGPP